MIKKSIFILFTSLHISIYLYIYLSISKSICDVYILVPGLCFEELRDQEPLETLKDPGGQVSLQLMLREARASSMQMLAQATKVPHEALDLADLRGFKMILGWFHGLSICFKYGLSMVFA